MSRLPIAIYGAAGYGGQELLRLLVAHPRFEVAFASSRRHAGKRVPQVLWQLDGFYEELRFSDPETTPPAGVAGAFLAVPYGAAQSIAARLGDGVRVVDLSIDHRDGRDGFVYGLTETNRAAVAKAARVANPGCYATGALLALAPLAERGLLTGDLALSQTTGSSGGGADPKPGAHHPERAADLRAYKVLTHQHVPEIERELARIGAAGFDVAMVPQSGPFARGIFTVAHARVDESVDVESLYAERYGGERFVRRREVTPNLRHVVRSNFCDYAVHRRGGRVVVLTAIDNLVKGMAGQAIQNLNLMCGLEETAGLDFPGANP